MTVSTCIPQFLKLYSDVVIFAGHDIATKKHSHHALELIIAFESDATVQIDTEVFEAKGILLKQDIEHATKGQGFMIFICISPECTLGRRLNYMLGQNDTLSIKESSLEQIKKHISESITHEHSETEVMSCITSVLIEDITLVEKNYPPDLRITNVISHIVSNLNKQFSFKELLEIACLSESRLIHLFKKEMGIPIRKYVLWCRLRQAIKYFIQGHTLTQSAHFAGFSDVAHLTRTFVSMFGMSPSQLLRNFN